MTNRLKEKPGLYSLEKEEEEKEFDLGSDDPKALFPLTITSRALCMLGDVTVGQAYQLTRWLELVQSRNVNDSEQASEVSLWERLGKAAMLDIESSSFSWNMLSSLHHIEQTTSTEQSEDEMNKALEVTVNSGGVVFFALFNQPRNDGSSPKEAAAVIKIPSKRMATQSERLGYEFAKWLGVRTPQQGRVIHNSSPEWLQIKEAADKVKDAAILEGDEISEMTCSELLEALDLSRCVLLMNYIHGSPLLESSNAFDSQEAAEKTAAALGRVMVLDLVIRNEDRLPCQQLRWRGNSANLLLSDKVPTTNMDGVEVDFNPAIKSCRPKVIQALQKGRRSTSVDSRFPSPNPALVIQFSDLSDATESSKSSSFSVKSLSLNERISPDFHIVAIDSGVPRRPPVGKRVNDQENYPKLVELLTNSSVYASNLLNEITGGKLGSSSDDSEMINDSHLAKVESITQKFRSGFRASLRDLQGFHIFLLTLHQKLESLLRLLLNIVDRSSSGDADKEEWMESTSCASGISGNFPPSPSKERMICDNNLDSNDSDLQRAAFRSLSSVCKESLDSGSPLSRDSWMGKLSKGNGDSLQSVRLASKLRDLYKFAKGDAELNKDLEQWNEMLKNDVVKLCQENGFKSGFFGGSDNNYVVDAYELKVRLEHILERISLISDAANTEKPSKVTDTMFIGGALAARSVYTLQHFGITHILCLCANEIGQSDSQFPGLFLYQNFSICDNEDSNITDIFEEAHDFIDHVEKINGKILVHCFEGKSRSATLVLAYLMLRKNFTLLQAWNTLKLVHRRALPNDGFARVLMDLDKKLHGVLSIEWQQRKPTMKVCSICGNNAGLSSSSLNLHLQKAHKKQPTGSMDTTMSMEVQKALDALEITRIGNVSPTPMDPHPLTDE
nr:dual specificity protein phosphatase PHS1 isoform X1 [Ipomoea batatas]